MKNLKKVISSVAALAIVASSASAMATTFPDVDASASYAKDVEALTALNVINGDDNGKFNPDNSVTRAEFTKMVVEARGEGSAASSANTSSRFADTNGHWAAGYVQQGVADGFINGYDDERFGPDDQVQYAQAVKMLVAAIGYDTYATSNGGYPSGYLSWGSQLDITSGVSGVTNETALTRAQCATLIMNAMKAPLCVEDGFDTISDGKGGYVQVPNLVRKNGKAKEFESLLTEKHDAYVVKGRVMATSKASSAGLEKGEVKFKVESTDRFEDTSYGTSNAYENAPTDFTMKAGDTKAADMQFEYAEAIVQKDDDTDEFTILSISQYGSSKTISAKADDVSDEDTDITSTNKKIAVYKTSGSSSTNKYDLSSDYQVYINGVETGHQLTDAELNTYIYENKTGNVTLVDATKEGSTATDGKYEYILIDYYVDAVVDSVTSSSTETRVYFKESVKTASGNESRLAFDPEDDDLEMNISKDGQAITYKDLKEYDVLSIAYDVVNNKSISDADYYDIKVSNSTAEGSLSGKDGQENTIRVNGTDYDLAANLNANDYELSTTYKLYLDAFGYVAYVDEGETDKNYGVIVAMYKSAGNDYQTVRFITSSAEVVSYECKNDDEAKKFWDQAMNNTSAKTNKAFNKDGSFTKNDVKAYGVQNAVVGYKLTSGKVKYDKAYTANGGTALEYKKQSLRLGSYSISDASTKLVDMDSYFNNDDSSVATLTLSSLENEAEYDAYLYDKNNAGDYRFGIVLSGTSSIRPETSIATVKKVVGQATVNDTDVTELTVVRNGEVATVYVDDQNPNVAEGSVIAYTVGSNGYIDSDKLYTIITPNQSYDSQYANTIKANNFTDLVNKNVVTTNLTDRSGNGYGIAYTDAQKNNDKPSKDCYFVYGIVYRKTGNSLELITKQSDSKSDMTDKNQFESFSIGSDTNVTVYDYNQQVKYRVDKGLVPSQGKTIFTGTYADSEENVINWNLAYADAQPSMALLQVVDNDVTNAVIFQAK